MRDRGTIDQIGELFDVLLPLLHVDRDIGVGNGGSLVAQRHLRFGSADPQALQDGRSSLPQCMETYGANPAAAAISSLADL